jgi:aspartate/methionine/tyrosine aminotransferase
LSEKYPFTLIKENIAKRRGKALDFAVGTQPFPLSSEMADWIQKNSELALAPATPKDTEQFSLTATGYLKKQYGLDISPQDILPTAGGRAGMSIVAACTLSPADTVMVTEPGYPAFARIAAQYGAKVIASQLNPDSDFSPEFEYSEDIARGSISMLAINYPNNPSGATLSQAVRDKLRDLAGHGTTLFNDATYGPLVYNQAPRSMLSEAFPADNFPKVLELHSFSKLFPIGPLAVSFLVGAQDLIQSMAVFSEYSSSPLSRLQLSTTAECLRDEDRIQQFRDHIPNRLDSLRSVLNDIGFKTFTANSGTYLICEVPQSIADMPISSAQSAAKHLMDTFDIAVVPLDTQDRSYLRFSGLYRPHDLERLTAMRPKLLIR